MPAWALPLVIQAGEALFLGVGTLYTVHTAGGDWTQAISAAIAAMIGKVIPSQVLGGGKATTPAA